MNSKIKNYYKTKNKYKKIRQNYNIKRNEDTIYKIIDNLSKRASKILLKNNMKLEITYVQLLGISPIKLKEYIKNKFTFGMSFYNYGEWEIDHIKPISKYDHTDIVQVLECFNYNNLQPLWAIENRMKSNKII